MRGRADLLCALCLPITLGSSTLLLRCGALSLLFCGVCVQSRGRHKRQARARPFLGGVCFLSFLRHFLFFLTSSARPWWVRLLSFFIHNTCHRCVCWRRLARAAVCITPFFLSSSCVRYSIVFEVLDLERCCCCCSILLSALICRGGDINTPVRSSTIQ